MGFVVEVERRFRAVQGLASPVRAARGLPGIPAGAGVEVVVTAGVTFREDQLTARGWHVDTDAVAGDLERCCADLESLVWTEVLDFRPTFELVARELYRRLAAVIPQLAFVAIRDEAFGVTTRYAPGPAHPEGGEPGREAGGG